MALQAIVKKLLPTEWSRLIAGLTILVAGSANSLLEFWPATYRFQLPEQILLLRALLLATILLAGALSVLAVVVVHVHHVERELADLKDRSFWETT